MSRAWLAGLAAAVVLSGCGDSAQPGDREYDPALVQAEMNGLWASFGLYIPFTANEEIAEFLAGASMDTLLGRTWEYDAEAGEYVASPMSGAPADGTRFLIYRERLTGGFELPLIQHGQLDVRATGTASRRELTMNSSIGGALLADLSAYATGTDLDGQFGVDGVVRSFTPEESIVVSLESRVEPASGRSRETIDMELRMEERALTMESRFEELSGGGQPASGELHTLLDTRKGLVELSGALRLGEVSGIVSVNGSDFAAFSGLAGNDQPLQLTSLDTLTVGRNDSLMIRYALNLWYFGRIVARYTDGIRPLLEPVALRK